MASSPREVETTESSAASSQTSEDSGRDELGEMRSLDGEYSLRIMPYEETRGRRFRYFARQIPAVLYAGMNTAGLRVFLHTCVEYPITRHARYEL